MNLLVIFTFGISLADWDLNGIMDRELLLYKGLLSKGIKTTFLTYGYSEDLNYRNKTQEISIEPIKRLIKSDNLILEIIKSFQLPIKLRGLFQNSDLIMTNQVFGGWVGVIGKLIHRKPFLLRGGYEGLRNLIAKPITKKRSLYFSIKRLCMIIFLYITELVSYHISDKIILTSKSDIEFVNKLFKVPLRKLSLIPNYVDTEKFKPTKDKKSTKKLVFVGRLIEEKNLLTLLKALKGLDDYSLDLIGKGPQEKKLRDFARNNNISVNFLGVLSNNDLALKLNRYEIFILPSHFEGHPKALIEAMSCGLACIGTEVRGIRDIIKHNETGFLCQKNYKSLRAAILTVSEDIQLKEMLSKNARKYVVKKFSIKEIIEKEYALINNLLK